MIVAESSNMITVHLRDTLGLRAGTVGQATLVLG
jgi:hypothetical protein